MAAWYVYSAAAGAGTGADWANAFTTIAAAIAAGAAGDTYYVAHDHAETAAANKTITFKGTLASPDKCLSVNRAGSVPPVAADLLAGASVETTGNTSVTISGFFYCYGVTFKNGTGAGGPSMLIGGPNQFALFEACAFTIPATGASARLTISSSSSGAVVEWVDCTASFSATGQGFSIGASTFTWRNKPGSVAITGATIPTTLFVQFQLQNAIVTLDGLDLSALGSGKTIFGDPTRDARLRLINCKLDASVTPFSTLTVMPTMVYELIGCHSSGNVARNERKGLQGELTTETTIVRTNGASDGVTAYSWKIVTTASNERHFPVATFEGALWNADTGSAKTLTIHIVTDNVTLTDAEIWLEVYYLGSSATPVASTVSDAAATWLTTPANQAASTETWTTTGLGTPVYQKLEVTFTPQMAGPIRWRVKCAKASTTVYVCPKPELA